MTHVKTSSLWSFARNSRLNVNNKIELDQIINRLQGFKLSKSDLKDEHEELSALIFIVSMFKLSIFDFPISIIWDESPDFRFILPAKKTLGIEHIRATLPEYKMAERELIKRTNAYLEPDIYSPFKKLPKNRIFEGIRNKGERLIGGGWRGDAMEIEWAEIIMKAITEKTGLLNKRHFNKFGKNELLIEDDSPANIFKDLEEGLKHLIKLFKSTFKMITFNKIHIFSVDNNSAPVFIYDVFNERIKVDVSKKNLHDMHPKFVKQI